MVGTHRRRISLAKSRKTWVQEVRESSDAMDLPRGIFTRDPTAIARGLKRAVLKSRRTKGTKFQSAMSMLNLFANRAGRKLPARDRARLEAAKDELRKAFGRPAVRRAPAQRNPARARRGR
jgi:Protein of unknown function (DUF3175)